jgi:hypothetical protein
MSIRKYKKRTVVSYRVTPEQAKFLDTLPNKSADFQKYLERRMLEAGSEGEEAYDADVANDLLEFFQRNFDENIMDDDKSAMLSGMSSMLYIVSKLGEGGYMGASMAEHFGWEEVYKGVSGKTLDFLRGVLKEYSETKQLCSSARDRGTLRVVFKKAHERLARMYRNRWNASPPYGWDRCIKHGNEELPIVSP